MAGFDCIIGNPPFLNQLENATASTGAMAAIVRLRSDGVVRGYTDLSATFLYFASRWIEHGGRAAMVQPQSLLAARDAAPVRQAVLADCSLTALWISNEHVFEDASVYVCAPTLQRSGPRSGPIARSATAKFLPLPERVIDHDQLAHAETWSHLAAAASGIPEVDLDHLPALSEIAHATADFRDQYYGLEGFLIENDSIDDERRTEAAYPRIITTGLIDLADCQWGTVSTRILKRKWNAPRIDRGRMEREGTLGPWIAARSIPKILLATQTKVAEILVDAQGSLVPSIPLITIMPHRTEDLWMVGAAVASPVASAIALCKYAGAALSADAIKLSATQVLGLPQPCEKARWKSGARFLEAAHAARTTEERHTCLSDFGQQMARAYGLPEVVACEVEQWWVRRLMANSRSEESDDD